MQRYFQKDFGSRIASPQYRKVPRRRQVRRLFHTGIRFASDKPGRGQRRNRHNSIPKQRLFVYPRSAASPVSIWIIANISEIRSIVSQFYKFYGTSRNRCFISGIYDQRILFIIRVKMTKKDEFKRQNLRSAKSQYLAYSVTSSWSATSTEPSR